jgi:hypothetical protein
MTKNIEDLLYRGDSLERMGDMSSRLREDSRKYKKAAVRINWELLLKQVGCVLKHMLLEVDVSLLTVDSTARLAVWHSLSLCLSGGGSSRSPVCRAYRACRSEISRWRCRRISRAVELKLHITFLPNVFPISSLQHVYGIVNALFWDQVLNVAVENLHNTKRWRINSCHVLIPRSV